MVRLRMQRFGRRHRPFYRINAIEKRTARNGKVIENLGYYDPMHPDEASQVLLKAEPIRAWLNKGAQPSETVMDLLATHDILNATEMAAWEAGRKTKREQTTCKQAVKAIEAIIEEIGKVEGDADTTPMSNMAKKALTAAKTTVSLGKTDEAAKAQAEAQKQLDAAKAAVPAPEPEPAAEAPAEEAPAAE